MSDGIAIAVSDGESEGVGVGIRGIESLDGGGVFDEGIRARELLTNCRVITSDISKPTILMKEKTTSGD